MPVRRVTLAAVMGAHGVTGEVRLKLFAESADSLKRQASLDANGRTLTLKSVKPTPRGVIARFAEIGDRNAAEALRGTELTIPRDSLPTPPAGEIYIADLIGLAVVTDGGDAIGTIAAVENYGAGDILEIEKPDGTRFMVPFNAEAVPVLGAVAVLDPAFVQ